MRGRVDRVYFLYMAGGGHHEPPVFTHFLPGMVAGIVLGAVVGSLFVANLATESLQTFWEITRPIATDPNECASLSSVRISPFGDEGVGYTSVTIGGSEEILMTLPQRTLRIVPLRLENIAYVTTVAGDADAAAFPANSLYRVDLCGKTITHVLGSTNEPANILGMSLSGTWVLYANANGLMVMNTAEHRAITLGETAIPQNVLFSPADDAFAVMFANGNRTEWILSDDGNTFVRQDVQTLGELPAWTFQTAQEYFAEIN
jgi:hypothetical protein